MRHERANRCSAHRLPDGRNLVYTLTGPRDGTPVLYSHGAIGTPVEATVDLLALTELLNVLYIAPSRPGVGGSDPSPGRTIIDFAADVESLADELDLGQLSVAGVSAGGPYALAIAHRLGARVRNVALCSSLSPRWRPHRTPGIERRISLALAALASKPGLCRTLGDVVLPVIARHPELITRVISAHAAPAERSRLELPAERSAATHSFLDAARHGVGGLIDDYLTYACEWGFEPAEIGHQVHLWHGAADPLVPVEHALQLATELPRCRVFFDPDEGHHFFRSNLAQILAVLVGREAQIGSAVKTTIADARELVHDQAAARSSASGGRSSSLLSTVASVSRPGARKVVGSGPSRRPSR